MKSFEYENAFQWVAYHLFVDLFQHALGGVCPGGVSARGVSA